MESNQVPKKNLGEDPECITAGEEYSPKKTCSPQGADSKKSTPNANKQDPYIDRLGNNNSPQGADAQSKKSTNGSGDSPQEICSIKMGKITDINLKSPIKPFMTKGDTATPLEKAGQTATIPNGTQVDLESHIQTGLTINLQSNRFMPKTRNDKKSLEKLDSKEEKEFLNITGFKPSETKKKDLKVWVKRLLRFFVAILVLSLIGVIIGLFIPCGILGFSCPCEKTNSCTSNRSNHDPGLQTVPVASRSRSLVDQLLDKDFSSVFRAYLAGETVKYNVDLSRTMKTSSPFNTATGTGEKIMSNYTVWMTTIFAEKDIVGVVAHLGPSWENLVQRDSMSFENTLLTAANLSQLPLKAIQCNISRYGAEKVDCTRTNNIEDEEWMAMNSVLSQFLQVLEKNYVTIFEITNGQTRILSGGQEVISRNNETLRVEGVLGGDYNKNLTFLVSKNSSFTQVIYQNEYTQTSFGLYANNQEYLVNSRSNLDPVTFIMNDAEINATLFCEANKTHIVQQRLLYNSEVPVNSVNAEYSMKITLAQAPQVMTDANAISLAKLTMQIPGRIIQNSINNNTIYPKESSAPLLDYAGARLLQTEDPNYFQHIRLMERDIVGSDAYGFVDVFCYYNDTCLVSGWIQLGNLKPIEVYNYTINITLNQTISNYNSINYQALKQIKDLQDTIDRSLDSLKVLHYTFLADNGAFINDFTQTMDAAIYRFQTIFEELSNLTSLEPFITQIIAIIQPQFDTFLENFDSYATNSRQWLDYIAWNYNSACSDLQCQIKADKTLLNQSLRYVPTIYQNFSGLFSNQLQNYYNILLNGIHNQSVIVINQLVNNSMSNIANDSNLSVIVSNYVNKRLNSFFVSMQTKFDQVFTSAKILYNLKYVETAESINGTTSSFTNFLTNSNIICNNSNALNWNISVLLLPNNIDDIYASFHFQSESSSLVSFSSDVNTSLQPIVDQLVGKMVSEIKIAIIDPNSTFSRMYNETTVNLTQTLYSIKGKMLAVFQKFKSDVQKLYSDHISAKANQTLLVFQKLGDPAYTATQEDVQNIDYNFLNQNNAKNSISGYSSSLDNFSLLLNNTNTSDLDSIYGNHDLLIQNKTSELNFTIFEAKSSVIQQSQILDYFNLTIALLNLSGFQTEYMSLFSDAKYNSSILVLDQEVNEGKNLNFPEVIILQQNLSKSLAGVLSSANQEMSPPLIRNITQNHTLFFFPGLVGNVDVNFLLALNSSIRVEMISGTNNISLQFILDAQVGGMIKTQSNGKNRQEGLYVLTDLYRGSSVATFAYNFDNLVKSNKLEQNIQNLGVKSGFFSRDCQENTYFKCFQLQDIVQQNLETCLPVKNTNCDPVQRQFEVNQGIETLMDQYPLI